MSPVEVTKTGATIITGDSIELFRKLAIEKACRIYADTGVKVARNLPTVKSLRRQYPEILDNARTYRQAADLMRTYLEEHHGC